MAEKLSHKQQKQAVPENQQSKSNPEQTRLVNAGVEQLGLQLAMRQPSQARPDQVLSLQRQVGNQQVLRMVAAERMDREITNKNREINPDISGEIQTARMGGQPLSSRLQRSMGASFKQDFSRVRVHTDDRAGKLSQQLKARAFTIGNDIFFGKNAYSPGTPRGERTLRHELTHVIQQGGRTTAGPLKLGKVNDRAEQEAERQAGHAQAAPAQVSREALIQRDPNTGRQTSVPTKKHRPLPPPPNKPLPQISSQPSQQSQPQQQTQSQQTPVTNTSSSQPRQKPQRPTTPHPPLPQKRSFPKKPVPQPPQKAASPQQSQAETPPTGIALVDWQLIKMMGIANKTEWEALKPEYQNIIKTNVMSPALGSMVRAAKSGQWPKDGADQEITDPKLLQYIALWIKYDKWETLPKEQRGLIIEFQSDDSLCLRLVLAAKAGKWPLLDDTTPIYDKALLLDIHSKYMLNIIHWNAIPKERRMMLLAARAAIAAHADELVKVIKGDWPKDGTDKDFADYIKWASIKAVDGTMTIKEWNTLSKLDRAAVIADPTRLTEKLRAKGKQDFARNKNTGVLEKIDSVTGHGGVGILSDTLGTTSSIAGSFEDNDAATYTSAGTGLAGNIVEGGSKFFGMLSGFQSIHRGRMMRRQGRRASRAQRQMGKKLMTKGSLQSITSTIGLVNQGVGAGSNIAKLANPDANTDAVDATSSGISIVSGLFDSVLGGKSWIGSMKRRSKAKNIAKKTTNADLKSIAEVTSKKQNVSGRGLGALKGLIGIGGGISGLVGSLMPEDSRLGANIAGSVLSGLGLLTGIGQVTADTINSKTGGDAGQKAAKLIDLLKQPNPVGKEAAEFAIKVLKINVGKQAEINKILADQAERVAWVTENEDALKALIESKMDKT
jgi:hypothetical protein